MSTERVGGGDPEGYIKVPVIFFFKTAPGTDPAAVEKAVDSMVEHGGIRDSLQEVAFQLASAASEQARAAYEEDRRLLRKHVMDDGAPGDEGVEPFYPEDIEDQFEYDGFSMDPTRHGWKKDPR